MIQLSDILTWKRIQTPIVSSDGQWFAYRLAAPEGNAEAVVRNLQNGQETRYPAGDLRVLRREIDCAGAAPLRA